MVISPPTSNARPVRKVRLSFPATDNLLRVIRDRRARRLEVLGKTELLVVKASGSALGYQSTVKDSMFLAAADQRTNAAAERTTLVAKTGEFVA